MPLYSPAIWSWKGFCNVLEYTAGVGVIGCALWSAAAAPEEKLRAATCIAAFATVGLSAKFCGNTIGSRKQKAQELRNQNRAKQIARVMLESMQRFYFKDQDGTELHKHRFTLYKEVEPGTVAGLGGHLVIFARAGDHAGSTRVWPIDGGQAAQCRGIAGQVWYTRTTIFREAACDWPENDNPIQKQEYADSLGCTVAEVEHLNVKAHAFAGALVTVGGRRWGVLLLDSLTTEALRDTPARKRLLDSYAAMLGVMLTEAIA